MRKIVAIFCLLAGMTAWVSCGNLIETSGNGKLDGFWLLTTIDTIGGGTGNVSADRKFLSVQGSILQVHDADDRTKIYMFRFDHHDGSLTLSDARVNDRTVSDTLLVSPDVLRPFGINSLTEKFAIEFDGSDKMLLHNDMLRLHFRRF